VRVWRPRSVFLPLFRCIYNTYLGAFLRPVSRESWAATIVLCVASAKTQIWSEPGFPVVYEVNLPKVFHPIKLQVGITREEQTGVVRTKHVHLKTHFE
jgi:hypothetical protein